jgi:NhaA family Na+:H+ antiporter
MVVPALIYVAFNAGTETSHGWGVPMATDIAYSLGIISLLGKRIPLSIKVFLTALAIVDDIGAVLVIAIFYSADISWTYLGIGSGILLLAFALNKLKVNNSYAFTLMGAGLWYAFLEAGIHPTLAGVLLAFTIPIQARMKDQEFQALGEEGLSQFREVKHPEKSVVENKPQLRVIESLRKITKKFRPMAVRLERRLEGFNSFFVMPIFALANAGVTFEEGWTQTLIEPMGLGIFLGLVVGKVAGITLFSWGAIKTKIGQLPEGTTLAGIIGIGLMAGIGFTMSLFISNLAFEGDTLPDAKIAVLIASFIAAIAGLVHLRLVYRRKEQLAKNN